MSDTATQTSHRERVHTLLAEAGVEPLDFYVAPNNVVRVKIAPLLMPFADVNRTLHRRMAEHGWIYGVSFTAAFAGYADELTFRPPEAMR